MAACDRVLVMSEPQNCPTSLNVITVRATAPMAEERAMAEVGPLHQEHPVEHPEGTPPLGEDEARALDTQMVTGGSDLLTTTVRFCPLKLDPAPTHWAQI